MAWCLSLGTCPLSALFWSVCWSTTPSSWAHPWLNRRRSANKLSRGLCISIVDLSYHWLLSQMKFDRETGSESHTLRKDLRGWSKAYLFGFQRHTAKTFSTWIWSFPLSSASTLGCLWSWYLLSDDRDEHQRFQFLNAIAAWINWKETGFLEVSNIFELFIPDFRRPGAHKMHRLLQEMHFALNLYFVSFYYYFN